MAVVENRFVCDLSKPVQAQALKGNVFSLDNLGSRISVLIYDNGQPATISGSVTANCILPDGSTVNVNGGLTTENGGSKAYVDVPQSCLLIPGILKIAIKCTSSSVITTLAAIVANVYMTKTDNVITPSQQIINDWNAEVSAAIATQNAAIANQDTKINDLKSALEYSLGQTFLTPTGYGKYIPTASSPVDITDLRTGSNYWAYYIIDCSANDLFIINGQGGQTPRLWCFIDSSGNILSNADASVTETDKKIIAPTNSSKLIINDVSGVGKCYKGELVNKRFSEIKETEDYIIENATQELIHFIPGGIELSTGIPINSQKYRLHSAYFRTDRTLKITKNNYFFSTEQAYVMFFSWDSYNPLSAYTSKSDWILLSSNKFYKIPAGKWVRILLAYGNESGKADITNPTNSDLYNLISIVEENDSDNIIVLNKAVEPNVQSLPTSYPDNAKSFFSATHTPLCFMHFSDIHDKPILWERAAKYCDWYKPYISFALHTGDYVGDNQNEYTDLYSYYMPSIPFLNCVGNHDTYTNSQHTKASKESVHDLLFNHTDGWGVTFNTDIPYSMSYYKDFPSSRIRLIVLDNYYDIEEQNTWLAGLLSWAKTNGYHVITAAHQVTGSPHTKVDCTFQTLIPYENMSGSVVDTSFDAVIGDFISGGGKHIVHLAGHEHDDFLYYTANGVLNCAVECATTYLGWTEGARVEGTKTYDCFNCVGADTDLGTFKIVRIGANCDSHNRVKNVLSYDYINKKVLCNW